MTASVLSNSVFALYASNGGFERSIGTAVIKGNRVLLCPKALAFVNFGTKTHETVKRQCRWLAKDAASGVTLEKRFAVEIRIEKVRVPEGRETESRDLVLGSWKHPA